MLLFTVVILFVVRTLAQNPSPCPSLFAYEPRGQEQDRWYGRLTVTTVEELNGVWLRIQLNQPAELLGVIITINLSLLNFNLDHFRTGSVRLQQKIIKTF